jgi:hypothetical protein
MEFTGSGTFDRSCADDWRSYGEWSLQRNVGSVSVLSPLIGDFVAAELHSRSCAQPPPPSHGWDQTYSAASTAAGMWTKTYAHAANLSPCSGNETEGGTVGWAWDPLEIGWNIGLGCIIDLYAAYIGVPTDYWPFSPPPNVTLWEPTEFEVFGFSEHGGSHQFHLDNEYTTTMLEVNTFNDLAVAPSLSTLAWSEGWHKRMELEGYVGVDDWTLGASYIATETVAAYTAACWVVDAEQVRCQRARIEYRLKVQTEPNIVNRVNVYEIFADTTGAKSIARTVPAFVMGTGQEVILEDLRFAIPPPASKGWQYPTVLVVRIEPVTAGQDPTPLNPATVSPGAAIHNRNVFEVTISPNLSDSDLPTLQWCLEIETGATDATIEADPALMRYARVRFPSASAGNNADGRVLVRVDGAECAAVAVRFRDDLAVKVKAHVVKTTGGLGSARSVTDIDPAIRAAMIIWEQAGLKLTSIDIVEHALGDGYDTIDNNTERNLLFDVDEDDEAIDIYFVRQIDGGEILGDTLNPASSLLVEAGVLIADDDSGGTTVAGQLLIRVLAHEIGHYIFNRFVGEDVDHEADGATDVRNIMFSPASETQRDVTAEQASRARGNYSLD